MPTNRLTKQGQLIGCILHHLDGSETDLHLANSERDPNKLCRQTAIDFACDDIAAYETIMQIMLEGSPYGIYRGIGAVQAQLTRAREALRSCGWNEERIGNETRAWQLWEQRQS